METNQRNNFFFGGDSNVFSINFIRCHWKVCAKMESCSKQSPLIYPLQSVTQHRSGMNFWVSAVPLVLLKVTATLVTLHSGCSFETQPQLQCMRRHSFSIAGFQGFGQWLSETGSFWWACLNSCLFTWGWKLIHFPDRRVLFSILDAVQSPLILNVEPFRTGFWCSLFAHKTRTCQGDVSIYVWQYFLCMLILTSHLSYVLKTMVLTC
jgi:hypothetical protein